MLVGGVSELVPLGRLRLLQAELPQLVGDSGADGGEVIDEVVEGLEGGLGRTGEAAPEQRHRLVDLLGGPLQALVQGSLVPSHIWPVRKVDVYQGRRGQHPLGHGVREPATPPVDGSPHESAAHGLDHLALLELVDGQRAGAQVFGQPVICSPQQARSDRSPPPECGRALRLYGGAASRCG